MTPQQLILTTEQLAQAFGVTSNRLVQNFQRHKEDFREGVHYFVLEGEELKKFENDHLSETSSLSDHLSETSSLSDHLSETSSLKRKEGGARRKYLWTQAGAFAHVWILKSAGAKAAYEKLIERAEKPQADISQEVYLALQEQCDLITQFAVEQTEAKSLDNTDLDVEQLGDIDRILVRIEKLYSQGKQDASAKALLKEIKIVRAMIAQTQEKLEHADQQFIAQEKFKKIVLSPERLIAASSHFVPLLEAPNE